jgi:uncharacterized membrane protein YqhA
MSEAVQDPPPVRRASDEHAQAGFLEHLLKARYVAAVVVVLSLLHSLMFLFIGARSAVVTYWHVITGSAAGGRPGLELLHSLDLFLISLVLLILALGVAKLFLRSPTASPHPDWLPSWLHIETFGDLKFLLWESILTTLLIAALPSLASGLFGELTLISLVVPATILLLALSLYFMRKA